MPYGMEIYDANGKLVASSDQMSFVLRKTGSGTTVSFTGGGYSLPSCAKIDLTGLGYDNPIVALACGSTMSFIGDDITGKKVYGCSGAVGTSFNYYVFDNSGTIPPANFGLEIYDENGNITFSTNQRMMKPLEVLSHDPSPSGAGGEPNTTGMPSNTYTGKSVAVAPTTWAGYKWLDKYGSGVCYDGGGAGTSWEPGMSCVNLQVASYHDMLGGNVTNSGQTASIDIVPWENITLTTSSSEIKTLKNFFVKLTMLVLDVTDVPIGVTYY